MTDIKFRALDKQSGKIIYQDNAHYAFALNQNGIELVDLETCGVVPAVFMQYTNMNDKLGNEIYKGDIVQMNCPNQFLCGNYEIRQAASGEWRMDRRTDGRVLFFSKDNVEVIGNIYDDKHEPIWDEVY